MKNYNNFKEKIAITSDHAGFNLKQIIKSNLTKMVLVTFCPFFSDNITFIRRVLASDD